MKFVPRQPPPPPARPHSRSTTTRFLRLQESDDVPPSAEDGVKFEPRPLPEYTPPPSAQPRPGSGRLRLRLAPEEIARSSPDPARPAASAPLDGHHASDSAYVHEAPREAVDEPDIHETAEHSASLEAINDVALAEVATAEPEAAAQAEVGVETIEPEYTEPACAEEAPAPENLETPPETAQAPEIAATYTEPTQSDLFEIPPVAETVAQVWTPPGPNHATVTDWLPAPEPVQLAPAAQPGAPTQPPVPSFQVPRPLSTRRRTEPVYLPDNHFTRPELRRPGLSPAHRTRAEQPLGRVFWLVFLVLVIVLAGALYFFWLAPRIAALQAQYHPAPAAPTAVYPVAVVQARATSPVTELPVSGTVEPARETALYARTTGYVKDWKADIGDHVQADQVLAELDTPDVDHQLVQARATEDQAKAALALAQNEADRWAGMAHDHAVSQADSDVKTAALNEAKANDNAAEAAVGRLADLESFKEIRAPYAGTVTARNLEVGALVGVGPGPVGTELFRVIQTDPVRIFVNVPEDSAPSVRPHLPAKLQVAAFPGRVFTGEVVRDAGALDARTHLLRTEIHVANPDGALLPGTMADVHLILFDPTPSMLVPLSALVVNPAGATIVRVVSESGRQVARFTPVKVGREIGTDVEVVSDALHDGDNLVANPPPDLKDGMAIVAQDASLQPPSLLPPKPSAPRA